MQESMELLCCMSPELATTSNHNVLHQCWKGRNFVAIAAGLARLWHPLSTRVTRIEFLHLVYLVLLGFHCHEAPLIWTETQNQANFGDSSPHLRSGMF